MEDPTVIEQLNANMMFFRGLEFFALSVVGEYVGRIYLAMHDDPQFVIRERFSALRSPRVVQVHAQKESNEHHDHPATR
jgi:undecaprenyl-phosphate 4-deoxy-4-formamido-L-arabinose transferase